MPDPRLTQFAQDVHIDVVNRAADDSAHLREETFTEHVLSLLSEHDEVSTWEICSYEARRSSQFPAAKLNAWSLAGDGATLDLFVSLYHGRGDVAEVSKRECPALLRTGRWLPEEGARRCSHQDGGV